MLEPAEVAYPIRTIFGKATNVGFRHAKVREVDHVRNVVLLEGGSEIAFDHLVVATGATASYFGIPGAPSTPCRSTRSRTRASCETAY